MIEKALMGIAAAAAVAAAAVIGVIAAAFALWTGLYMLVGQAWAAAIVAAVAFVFVLAVVAIARSRAGGHRPRRPAEPEPDASLIDKAVELAREHPLLAVGAAVGAGIYAIRNPQLVAAVVTAFMAGRDEPK
ncbi:MAG TPA: hypothetical protein VF138_09255 [Caulobacteraceae bacterium]